MRLATDYTNVFLRNKLDKAKFWNGTNVSDGTSCFSLSLDLLSDEPLLLLKLSGSFLSQPGNLLKMDTKKMQ